VTTALTRSRKGLSEGMFVSACFRQEEARLVSCPRCSRRQRNTEGTLERRIVPRVHRWEPQIHYVNPRDLRGHEILSLSSPRPGDQFA
jgi:hypothetical protein